jgi:predicted amidohydrolase YtcJ
MMTSGWDFYIWEARGQDILRDYGERGAMQVVPRKSLYDAGIINSMELDRAIASTNLTLFHVLYSGVTRKDWDGNVTAPQQGVDRQAMLKSATLWGAYGSKKEDVLGSLEPGKLGDLLILDRDYLTIPEDDIKNVRVLMTMVGGKVAHLVPSLAREFGNVTAPQQGVDRQAMLKSATLWGAYGSKKEDVLGSLEPGKLGDLLILDRDYLTIPEDDIKNVRVLMTMVGGKVAHLVPSLAREFGMQPTGAQVELGGPAAQW